MSELFKLEKLRLSQDFVSNAGVRKKLTTVPVRKPGRQEFIRVRPGSEWRLETAIIELKEDNEFYLVDKSLWSELPGEIVPKVLLTTTTRQNVLLLWPIRLPGEDGRLDDWNRSALEAAELATKSWIRISANRSLGAYDVYQATGDLPQPEFPDVSFEEILEIAFKGRFIQSLDHPIVKRLRGDL